MRNNFKALVKVQQGSTENEPQNCVAVPHWLEDQGRLSFPIFSNVIKQVSRHLYLLSMLGCIFSIETVGDTDNYSKLFLLKTLNSLTSTFPCILPTNQASLCLGC